MGTARKIFSNTVAQFISKILTGILGLAAVKIGTHYLGVAGFGEYTLVYEFLAFFGIAADLGLFTIAVKEMSEDESQIPKIIGNIISLRTVLIVATMLLAIITVFFIPAYSNTRVPLGVAIASITVFFTIMNGTISAVLQTKLKMEVASATAVLGKILSVGLMLYVVFFGYPLDTEMGFYMLIIAGTAGTLLTLITTNHYVKKITPLKYRFDLDLWKKILKKSLPYGLALILNAVYFRVDILLISLIKGQEEVGIYAVAMKMLEQFAILPLYFMNSVLPVLTKAIKKASSARLDKKIDDHYKQIIRHAFDFLAAMAVPIVVGTFVLAFPIVFIVATPAFLSNLSEGFIGSDIGLQVLIFALFFQFLNVLFAFILIAIDQQTKLLYINAIGAISNVILNLLVIPKYGFIGAAATSVFSEFYILAATFYVAKKYLNFSLSFINLGKIMLSATVMGLAVYFLREPTYGLMQNWNVLLLAGIGGVIYVGMLLITGTIGKETIAMLRVK